jgi:hypothetical protein
LDQRLLLVYWYGLHGFECPNRYDNALPGSGENISSAALHNGMELLIGAGLLFVVCVALKSARFGALKRPPRAVYRLPER